MAERLSTFRFWCQKVLPLVYDESLSYYELLCKVVDYLNKLIDGNNQIRDILDIHERDIIKLKTDVDFLQEEMEKVKNGEYVSLYLDSIIAWIDKNLITIVSRIVKFVFFELDDSGHLIAYIPDSWQFLEFDTIMNCSDANYGHLTLEW